MSSIFSNAGYRQIGLQQYGFMVATGGGALASTLGGPPPGTTAQQQQQAIKQASLNLKPSWLPAWMRDGTDLLLVLLGVALVVIAIARITGTDKMMVEAAKVAAA